MKLDENQKKAFKQFLISAGPYWAIALIIGLGGALILDILTPTPPMDYIYLFGFKIWEIMPNLLLGAIALGWIIHGVGFFIVRA